MRWLSRHIELIKTARSVIPLSFSFFFLQLPGNAILAQSGPGGVGNSNSNKIWLKADEGIVNSTSNRVEMWVDQSGNVSDARQSLLVNRPSYELNGQEPFPFIKFNRTGGVQYFELTSDGISQTVSNDNSIFVVGNVNGGGTDNTTNTYQSFVTIPGYHSAVGVYGYPQTTGVYLTNWFGGSIPGTPTHTLSSTAPLSAGSWNIITRIVDEHTTSSSLTGFLNGALTSSGLVNAQMTNYNNNIIRIGAGFTSGNYTWALNGGIAEVIVYNKALNHAERIAVENYLSSKYNLPIENDKFDYDGSTGFGHDVAGIGRYDAENFHYSGSSVQLNITHQSGLDDGEYIFLGHNNQPLLLNNIDAPNGMKRLQRVWRSDVTGMVDAVSLSFDVSKFSSQPGGQWYLLVDSDGQFTNAVQYPGTVTDGTLVLGSSVTLTDGDYITIGYSRITPGAPLSLSYSPEKIYLTYGSSYTSSSPVISNDGTSVSLALINPPDGVEINSNSGVLNINGLVAPGTYQISIQATNEFGSSNFMNVITLTVVPYIAAALDYPAQTISLGNEIEILRPYLPQQAFQYSVVSGSLKGLQLNSATGEITGVPSMEGTTTAVIRASPVSPYATGVAVTRLLHVTALGANGPAGIGGPLTNKFWLDGSHLSGLNHGDKITTLTDRSGNGWNAVQSSVSRKPTFFANQLNGKAVLRFNRSSANQYLEITNAGIGGFMSNSNTLFVVAKANTGAMDNATNSHQSIIAAPGYHSTIAFSGYPQTVGTFFINYVGGTIPGGATPTYLGINSSLEQGSWYLFTRKMLETSTTIQTAFQNGSLLGTPVLSGSQMNNYNNNIVRIGSALPSGQYSWPLNGDVAEIIGFNASLNEAQRIIMENYLSAKFNLPITYDRLLANDSEYIEDVIGIGTTDGKNSNTHSTSWGKGGLRLAEDEESLNSEDEFLFATHSGQANSIVQSEDVPFIISNRWARTWYLEKTGTINAKIAFSFTDSGIPVPVNLDSEIGLYKILYKSGISDAFSVLSSVPEVENGVVSFIVNDEQLLNGYYTLGYASGIIWTGTNGKEWNDPGNWNLARIPNGDDHVLVNACTNCPELAGDVNVAGIHLGAGAIVRIKNNTLHSSGTIVMNGAKVISSNGQMVAQDFSDVKSSQFVGTITLEKTGGGANNWFGDNMFNSEVRFINSSGSEWRIASEDSNILLRN